MLDFARNTRIIRRAMFACLTILLCAAAAPYAAAADIVNVTVISQSTTDQSNVPITFGQVFKDGDVPATSDIGARLNDGTVLDLQVDKKATNADGSLRHAVLSTIIPALPKNGSVVMTLFTQSPGTHGPTVALNDLLATGFDATISLNVGGTLYTASARDMLQNSTPKQWLSGDVASEWLVGGPVKTAGGTPHPHLAAYFHIRAYAGMNSVRVDAIVENDWTFVPNPSNFTYDVTISSGGSTVYSQTGLTHYHHARWHKVFWWGIHPQVFVGLDKVYLQDTKAVPKYLNVTPSASYLSGMRQSVAPMSNGDLNPYMPSTGADDGIGPLPRWTAVYLVSMDPRAEASMLANGDAGGSYSSHYRDQTTGYPVSIADHPNLSENSGTDLPACNNCSTPLTHDYAHQPSIAYVPYLVTGDYYYLEELQFWADWNMIWTNAGYRQYAKGIFVSQVRGQAWALRELARAAYITPDNSPLKQYFVDRVNNNIAYNTSLYPDNPNANHLGALQSYDGYTLFAPWMDDFYTWMTGELVELGFTNAVTLRNWKAMFPVGRMGQSSTEYCWVHGSAYHLTVGTSNSVWWPDFRTLYVQNFPTQSQSACPSDPSTTAMDGYPDSPTGYPSNLRPALAIAVDSGVTGASQAWQRLVGSKTQPDYSNNPIWAIVPRGTVGPPQPSITLTANPNLVQSGGSATLTWSASNASSCTASGAWSGSQTTSGSQSVGPLTASKTYTLSCTGTGGTTSSSVTVGVAAAGVPSVNLTASTSSVTAGGNVTLTWTALNVSSCTASGAWSGTKAVSGSASVGPINGDSTFQLNCTGNAGNASDSVAVSAVTAPSTGPSGDAPLPLASSGGGGGAFDIYFLSLLAGLGAAMRRRTHQGAVRGSNGR